MPAKGNIPQPSIFLLEVYVSSSQLKGRKQGRPLEEFSHDIITRLREKMARVLGCS